jgi:hypothetical protein
MGYQAPQDAWLRGDLGTWVRDQLRAPALADVACFEAGALAQMQRLHDGGRADYSSDLWRWASLAEWLRLFAAGVWRDGLGAPGSRHGDTAAPADAMTAQPAATIP